MADKLNAFQLALLKDQFEELDKDGDGKLTREDTAAIMRSLGQNPTEAEITAKHKDFDKNGNGTIEFEEFVEVMGKTMRTESVQEEEIMQLFEMLDEDMDGFLNRQELAQTLSMPFAGYDVDGEEREALNAEEVDEMLEKYDADKDGKLNLEEFANMMKDQIYGSGLAQLPD